MSLEGNKSDFDNEMKILDAIIDTLDGVIASDMVETMRSISNEWTAYLKPSIEDALSVMLEDE